MNPETGEFEYQIIEIGHPLLSQPAKPVEDFACPALRRHIEAMRRLMLDRQGVGIAAPQVGVGLQLMIIASRPNERYPNAPHMEPLVMVNPQIKASSEDVVVHWEGCLSVPGIRGRVIRSENVDVVFKSASGDSVEMRLDGFPARIFLHEYDHLVGKTFLDRVASTADLFSEKEYLKQFR